MQASTMLTWQRGFQREKAKEPMPVSSASIPQISAQDPRTVTLDTTLQYLNNEQWEKYGKIREK
jgi:hypothetical protein